MSDTATACAEALAQPDTTTPDPAGEVRALRDALAARFVERTVEAHLLVLCLVAQTHLTLVGEPGNAKSLIVRDFANAITDARYFETQVAADSPAQRVLGPYSIPALDEGRFEFNVEGMLPEANIALLDEGYRANATFLDNLLAILNERIFHNGRTILRVPLWMAVIACNQLPDPADERTEAFRDRIAVTRHVQPVRSEPARLAVLTGQLDRRRGTNHHTAVPTVATDTVRELQRRVADIDTPAEFLEQALRLWSLAEAEGLAVSARRFGEIIKLAQAQAVLSGRTACRPSDLVVAEHVLWIDPDDAPLATEIASAFEDRTGRRIRDIGSACIDIEARSEALIRQIRQTDVFDDLPSDLVTEGVNLCRSAKELVDRIRAIDNDGDGDQTLTDSLDRITATSRKVEAALMGATT